MTTKHKITFWAVAVVIVLVAAESAYYAVRRPNSPVMVGNNASTTQPNGPFPTVLIHYTTSIDKAAYGNFEFGYQSGLVLAKDYIAKGANGQKSHALVFVDRNLAATMSLSSIPSGMPNQIFVNASPCSSYKQCQDVQGVPIGTNATDAAFIQLFNEFANNFSAATTTSPAAQ